MRIPPRAMFETASLVFRMSRLLIQQDSTGHMRYRVGFKYTETHDDRGGDSIVLLEARRSTTTRSSSTAYMIMRPLVRSMYIQIRKVGEGGDHGQNFQGSPLGQNLGNGLPHLS